MKTILIIEDIELNIDLLVQLLEDNYQILVARDGEEGVKLVLENQPDLILMDISLPKMDGYEATRNIRITHPHLPIIGLSAHAMQGDEDKALKAGCDSYLTKPVDENILLEQIRNYLG